jgi:hypothetical protein
MRTPKSKKIIKLFRNKLANQPQEEAKIGPSLNPNSSVVLIKDM